MSRLLNTHWMTLGVSKEKGSEEGLKLRVVGIQTYVRASKRVRGVSGWGGVCVRKERPLTGPGRRNYRGSRVEV